MNLKQYFVFNSSCFKSALRILSFVIIFTLNVDIGMWNQEEVFCLSREEFYFEV